MAVSSRGSAGIAALVVAAILSLGALWIAMGPGFGGRSADLERAIARLGDAGDPGIADPEATVRLGRADDLSKRLSEQVASVPVDVRLALPAAGKPGPEAGRSPPGVDGLEGSVEGSSILLTWRASGDEPATGYRVERIGREDEVLSREVVGPDVTRYRDGPVDALCGRRVYRVAALGRDGTVAGLQLKTVPYRLGFTVEYLGGREDGTARFRVGWERDGQRIAEEFAVAVGGHIGGAVPGREDRPALDLGTGWRFAGFAGVRRIALREAGVPRFADDGKLVRDPETGEAVLEMRKMPVAGIVEGAAVDAPRDDGAVGHLWLEKAKDD